MLLDDIGLPKCGDPPAFAAAFRSMTRDRQDLPVAITTRAVGFDEIGFPVDGDPADFARAFESFGAAQ